MNDYLGLVLRFIVSFLGYTVLCVLALVVGFYLYVRPSRRVDSALPGPKRHCLLGVTFNETSSDVFEAGESFNWGKWPTLSLVLSRQYQYCTWGGPTLNLGFGPAFFNIVNPSCLEYILQDNFENYVKGKVTKSFDEIMGDQAVFTSDGDKWKFHRRMVVGILNRETVQHASTLLLDKLEQVETYLKRQQQQEEEVDLRDLANKLIFDVFCKLQFGVDLNQIRTTTDNDDNKSSKQLQDFVKAFNDLQYYTHLRFNDLLWQIKQRWCLGERERKIVECKRVIDDFCWSVIHQTKKNNTRKDDDEMKKDDVVSKFIKYSKDREGRVPPDKEIRDFTMTLIMAGRDTTAASLGWIMWELTRHPQVLSKLRQEVDRVCQGKEDFSMEKVDSIDYLRAVVMESLRLHSPVPDTYRFSVKDDTLPDGCFIPAGSLVMYSPYTINHCETVWENPDVFDPERWMGRRWNNPSSFSFPTFNAGPRLCPGKNLALMELKTTIAFLTSKFDFVDEKKHSGDYYWTLVMSMKNGFPVKVMKRQR